MKENLIAKGVPAEKISVVYNWINTEATLPVSREENPLFEEFNLDRSQFIVTYAGNLGNSQNVELLVDCAEALKEKTDIRFVIFGSGSEKEKLEKRIADSGLANIELLPLQPMEKVSQVYSLGDASFVICKKGVGEGAFPSKAVSIMATGTPIIASFDLDSDLCRILRDENVGLCADAEDVAGAVAAIEKLYNDRALCAQMGENARNLACSRFSKEAGTAAKVAIYEKYARKAGEK
jgi:glycosyltransferase involved in cell wall biosynthesis